MTHLEAIHQILVSCVNVRKKPSERDRPESESQLQIAGLPAGSPVLRPDHANGESGLVLVNTVLASITKLLEWIVPAIFLEAYSWFRRLSALMTA